MIRTTLAIADHGTRRVRPLSVGSIVGPVVVEAEESVQVWASLWDRR
jgi:hypothetical protein